jgi:hypothetical protein
LEEPSGGNGERRNAVVKEYSLGIIAQKVIYDLLPKGVWNPRYFGRLEYQKMKVGGIKL